MGIIKWDTDTYHHKSMMICPSYHCIEIQENKVTLLKIRSHDGLLVLQKWKLIQSYIRFKDIMEYSYGN